MTTDELLQEVVSLTKLKNNANLILGEYLLKLKETGDYKKFSGEDSTFQDFLASPEIKLSSTTAYRYMTIYKKYVREIGLTLDDLKGLDVTMLEAVTKAVTKDNVREWLERVRSLSRSDIVRMAKHGDVDAMTCDHQWVRLPVKCKCGVCGEIKIEHESKN